MKLVRQIAFRHLKAPQKGSFTTFASILAILGLGLGIAALVLTFSILEGFESTISEKIAQFDGHIRVEHFMNRTLAENDAMLGCRIKSPFFFFIFLNRNLLGCYSEVILMSPERLISPRRSFIRFSASSRGCSSTISISRASSTVKLCRS